MDLPAAINGDKQLVNIQLPSTAANQTIYLSFYNLDLPMTIVDKPYQLHIQTLAFYGLVCFSCPSGMYLNSSCHCQTCHPGYYGKRCNYYIQTMSEDKKYHTTISTISNRYFRIEDPP